MRRHPVLAIDGPAGTGKTTSAAEVARRLGFAYVDSGALYRAIAVAARAAGIDSADDPALPPLLGDLPLAAEPARDRFRVLLRGEEVTDALREPEIASLASKLAVSPIVRARVGGWLHELARAGPTVIEGRDIGTAVFPDAELKIYLTATLDERARRRRLDLLRQGHPAEPEEVARQIEERDRRDSERSAAPLRRAADAVDVDTTSTDVEGQVGRILEAWERASRPRYRASYAIDQGFIRAVGRLLWGLRAEGAERIPRTGGLILAVNHKSYLDPLLVGACIRRETHYLAKRELFRIPLVSAWIRFHNAIPIDRAGFDREAIERCLGVLRGGAALLVFPEGTRILRRGFGPPKEGIAMLAARAGVPIAPVFVRGTWSGERRWFRPGGITIRYGEPFRLPPVPAGRAGRAQFAEIATRILESIARLDGAAESG